MFELPALDGEAQLTMAELSPAVATTLVGAPGTTVVVAGVAHASLEAAEDPTVFTAFTVK